MKRIILSLIILTAAANSFAQKKNSTTAFSGDKGNFIYNMFKPASPSHPDGDVTGFKIERKAATATTWELLRKFNTPEDEVTLSANVNKSIPMVFSFNPATAYSVEEVWPKFKKTFTYDSIGAYLTQQHLAIGFNAVLVDSGANKAMNYQYRVTQIKRDNTDGLSYTTNIVAGNQFLNTPKPVLKSRTTDGGKVNIVYKAKKTVPVDAILIKRKEGTGTKFERIETFFTIETVGDSLLYTVVDENITAEQLYQYTIMPVNRFGGEGKITSDTVYAAIVDKNYLLPQQFTAIADTLSSVVKLQWKFYKPELISVVKVFRSEDYEGEYTYIGAAEENSFTDASAITGKKYYYYLTITDRLGQGSNRSAKVFALRQTKLKSAAPDNVEVKKTATGNQITWTDYNGDTRGWWVYKTISLQGELSQLSEFIYNDDKRNNKLFIDTAKNTGTVGYAVVSENLSNVRSDFSSVAYVKQLQNAVIAPPVILDVLKSESKYRIFWKDDASGEEHISGYNIYRKSDGKTFVKVNKFIISNAQSSYTDSLKDKGFTLIYRIAVVNMAGKETYSEEYTAEKTADIYPASAIKSFLSQDKKTIMLTWQPSQSPVAKYEVYRFTNGVAPVKIGEVATGKIEYKDLTFSRDKVNYYYLVAVGFNGKRSEKSDETLLKLK